MSDGRMPTFANCGWSEAPSAAARSVDIPVERLVGYTQRIGERHVLGLVHDAQFASPDD